MSYRISWREWIDLTNQITETWSQFGLRPSIPRKFLQRDKFISLLESASGLSALASSCGTS